MTLRLDLNGMKIQLNIRNYQPYDHEEEDSNWCKVDYSFDFANCISYSKQDDEVLMSVEIEVLKCRLDDFIENRIESKYHLSFAEPDYEFIFIPSYNRVEAGECVYCRPGYEMTAPVIEWRINLWDDGLTDNYFSTTLDTDDAIVLRDYLRLVIGEIDEDSKIIQEHIAKGFIVS